MIWGYNPLFLETSILVFGLGFFHGNPDSPFFNLTSPRGITLHPGLVESHHVFMSHDIVDLLSLRQVPVGNFFRNPGSLGEVKNETN